jgi:hypothetical protein
MWGADTGPTLGEEATVQISDTTTLGELRAVLEAAVAAATAAYEEAGFVAYLHFLPDPDDERPWQVVEREQFEDIFAAKDRLAAVQQAQQALEDALAKIAAL